jgi:membrane protein involved in colicin uptake
MHGKLVNKEEEEYLALATYYKEKYIDSIDQMSDDSVEEMTSKERKEAKKEKKKADFEAEKKEKAEKAEKAKKEKAEKAEKAKKEKAEKAEKANKEKSEKTEKDSKEKFEKKSDKPEKKTEKAEKKVEKKEKSAKVEKDKKLDKKTVNGTWSSLSIKAAKESGETHSTHKSSVAGSGTYVEVSIAQQHLWFYEKGKLTLETDVVTGNKDGECDTPTGKFTMTSRALDTTLTGPGYSSFVNYWMGFYGGCGIHDASWR